MVRQKGSAKTIAGAHLNVDGSRHVLAGARVLDEEEHAFDGEIKSDAPLVKSDAHGLNSGSEVVLRVFILTAPPPGRRS